LRIQHVFIQEIYSKVWFNIPRLASAERIQRFGAFGIKPDDLINFLSNEATAKLASPKDTPRLASGSLILFSAMLLILSVYAFSFGIGYSGSSHSLEAFKEKLSEYKTMLI
jgi:hypothetical protein